MFGLIENVTLNRIEVLEKISNFDENINVFADLRFIMQKNTQPPFHSED